MLFFSLVLGVERNGRGEDQSGSTMPGPTQVETRFVQLLNDARKDPAATARALGVDPESVLEEQPELAPVFSNALPPLLVNEALGRAALKHCQDMIQRGYYSHGSPEGNTFRDRIVQEGYLPIYCGESLGILAFFNYMPPEQAADRLFENMFKAELDRAEGLEGLSLLNPRALEMGLSILPGTMDIAGKRYNVYLAVCNVGQGVSELEMGFLHLVNQARDLSFLPPLRFEVTLQGTAEAHAQDMLKNAYFSHQSLDGRDYEDRIFDAGYDAYPVGESIGRRALCNGIDEQKACQMLFNNLFIKEGDMNILDPGFSEAGIGMASGECPGLAGICGDHVLLLTADFGCGSEADPGIVGVVFQDLDGNGLYSMGEGMPAALVVAADSAGEYAHAVTDITGGFSLRLDPGHYILKVMDKGGNLLDRRDVVVGNVPAAVRFSVSGSYGLTGKVK